ncbi:MAG: hypothetical protein RRA51_09475 [Armatimonadota bacterium]|jgi:hypothetical protein|nr:hypothetical protein [Armatimonadota bacterium]
MEQSQPLRLEAKRVNRVAGWLLAVPVGFLWLLAVVFALLSLAALLQNGAVGLASGLVTGLVVLLAILLTGKVHDALAVYEFTLQDVSKRSPFREQRANWSEVSGWAISESDGIWWLLDKKGRVLLSLEWHTLPEEQVPAAKAFVVDHLRRHFLAMPSAHQTLLSRLRHFRRLSLGAALLSILGLLDFARKPGENVIAMMVGMALIAGILLAGVIIFSVFGRAKFLVCGDWLIRLALGVTIHLPSVQHLERVSNGIVLVGADGQKIFIPSHLTALWDYLRTRLPSVGDLEERTSQQA